MRVGDRVQTHPGTDSWMSGDRYGEIVKLGRIFIHVKMDRSGKVLKFSPGNLLTVDGQEW